MLHFALSAIELKSLFNSLILAFNVSLSANIIGLVLVFGFIFAKIPFKKGVSFLFLIPLLIPPYLHAFSWMHLMMFLGEKKLLGPVSCCGVELLSSVAGATVILTFAYFPIAFFLLSEAAKNISGEYIGAALIAADFKKVMLKIFIPQLLPSILLSLLLVFIFTFSTFDVPALLGINVFLTQIFKSFTFTNEFARAIYLSMFPVLIIGILWLVMNKFFLKNKAFFSLLPETKKYWEIAGNRNGVKMLVFSLFLFLILFSSLLPLTVLQLKNFTANTAYSDVPSSLVVISNTLGISFVSAVFLVFFSAIIFVIVYKKNPVRFLYLLLFACPPITFGIIFIYIFNRPTFDPVYSTPLILILAYAVRFSPLICELFYARKQTVNPSLIGSATLITGDSRKKLQLIIIPLYFPVIFLSFVLGFWLVATELPITLLIQPPGFQTIITRLFIVLHYGAVELMGPMTVSLLLISLIPIISVYWLLRKFTKYE